MKNLALKFSILLLITLTPLVNLSVYAASLQVGLNKNKVETGKYILATISYRGDSNPGELNLSEWRESFHVENQQVELTELVDGQIQSDTSVRLYPRFQGQLTLSSLAYGGAISASQQLTILPSIRNNIDSSPVLHSVQQNYWTDQAIMITVDIALHEKSNEIVVNDFVNDLFVVRTLKPERMINPSADVIRLQWMLLTPDKGVYQLELPSIQQRGRGRFRYYLPAVTLNIRPLPAYLPVTIPVGNIRVQSDVIKEDNKPASWLVVIDNSGRLPDHIEGLQTFLDKLKIAGQDVIIENKADKHSDKVSRRLLIKIPEWHLTQDNELELEYFDTTSGRLQVLKHSLPAVWRIPGYAWITIICFLLTVIIYTAYRVYKLALKIRQWRRFRSTIDQSTSANQLRKLMLQTNTSKNLTEFTGGQQDELLKKIVVDLNEICFNYQSKEGLEQVREKCLSYFTYKKWLKVSL